MAYTIGSIQKLKTNKMIKINFKKLLLDKLQKKDTFLNNYVRDRVFFGWQFHDDKGFHARIKHPRVRNSPCLTWKEARKIIMYNTREQNQADLDERIVDKKVKDD